MAKEGEQEDTTAAVVANDDDGGGSETDSLEIPNVMVDLAEMYAEEVLNAKDGAMRSKRLTELNYILKEIGTHRAPYGRLECKIRLVTLLVQFCSRPTYHHDRTAEFTTTDAASSTASSTGSPTKSKKPPHPNTTPNLMVNFTPKQYGKFIKRLKELRSLLLRNDADVGFVPKRLVHYSLVTPPSSSSPRKEDDVKEGEGEQQQAEQEQEVEDETDDPGQDETINTQLESDPLFHKEYYDIMESLVFHKCLSRLQRSVLEEELGHCYVDGRDTVRGIKPEDVLAFHSMIEKNFDEGDARGDLLRSMIRRERPRTSDSPIRSSTRSHGLSLKSSEELSDLMDRKAFDLDHLQKKVERLLLCWADKVFPQKGILPQLEYGTKFVEQPIKMEDEDEEQQAAEPAEEDRGGGDDETVDFGVDEDQIIDTPESTSRRHRRKKRKVPMGPDEDVSSSSEDRKDTKTRRSRKQFTDRDEGTDEPSSPNATQQTFMKHLDAIVSIASAAKQASATPVRRRRAAAASAAALEKAVAASTPKPVANAHAAADVVDTSDKSPRSSSAKKSIRMNLFDSEEDEVEGFESDDDEDEKEEAEAGETKAIALSELPDRAKLVVAATGGEDDAKRMPLRLTEKGHRQRRRFTYAEKAAIKAGVARFGFGRWAQIKETYKAELLERTSVQIKDCYRTMMRREEV